MKRLYARPIRGTVSDGWYARFDGLRERVAKRHRFEYRREKSTIERKWSLFIPTPLRQLLGQAAVVHDKASLTNNGSSLVQLHLLPVPDCVPTEFARLFQFLDSIAHLLIFGGIGLATIVILAGAVAMTLGGPKWVQKGKQAIINAVLGLVLLLTAHLFIAWVVGRIAPEFCV